MLKPHNVMLKPHNVMLKPLDVIAKLHDIMIDKPHKTVMAFHTLPFTFQSLSSQLSSFLVG